MVEIQAVQLIWVFSAATLLAAIGTWIVGKFGPELGLVDLPNARSSHGNATPRGGGIAIILVVLLLCSAGWATAFIETRVLALVGCAAVFIGGVGVADDFRSLRATTRLVIHILAAVLASITWATPLSEFGLATAIGFAIVIWISLVWSLNLYNFMDGIDGLAGTEALFIALSGLVLVGLTSPPSDWSLVLAVIAGACAGFLLFNWPPASIFMGDGGSGFLGFLLAVVAIDVVIGGGTPLASWILLGGIFITDATVTLIRRLLTGQRITEAHRSHAYQRLARRYRSHRRVTLMANSVNVFWLMPLAVFAARNPGNQWVLLVIGLAPLVLLEIALGAGRQENPDV